MKHPKLWLLEPGKYQCRIEFRFVDVLGNMLANKVWDLRRENTDPPKTILLQADARIADGKPKMKELRPNYWAVTTTVRNLEGEPCAASFNGLLTTEKYHQLLANHPLTLTLVMDNSGLHLALHTAESKT